MKKYNKYVGLLALSLAIVSCDNTDVYEPIPEPVGPNATLNTNGLDFSNYVSVGASFTAGFTDGALFKAGQENSFPNILASKFAMAGGGEFGLPLMNDNIGGLVFGNNLVQAPRFYFNGSGPTRLDATPTTDVSVPVTNSFNNYGIPGAKSFHFLASDYGKLSGLFDSPATANPYYVRMAPTKDKPITEIAMKQPTFFTLSEIGGNDVLGYALTGGDGTNPITPTATFDFAFDTMIGALTANPATKGVVGTVPYITSLAHFTTVPHNPLDPTTNASFAAQVPTLNGVFGTLNQVYTALGHQDRKVVFSDSAPSPVVIVDESLDNISDQIAQALLASGPAFEAFVTSFGLPAQEAPTVAGLLGQFYGQTRQATSDDLLVLPSSAVIGEVDTDAVAFLMGRGLSQQVAGQFSVEGITKPLEDKWVLTPAEQAEVKTAIDAYNSKITTVVNANENLALVDLNAILQTAATQGIQFDGYNMTTSLVSGGLISLDGIHLTGRGYALMANEMLKAIDAKFGSNFEFATNGLAKADDYPTNYSPALR